MGPTNTQTLNEARTHAPGCQAGRLVGWLCLLRARACSIQVDRAGRGLRRRGAARRGAATPARRGSARGPLSLSLSGCAGGALIARGRSSLRWCPLGGGASRFGSAARRVWGRARRVAPARPARRAATPTRMRRRVRLASGDARATVCAVARRARLAGPQKGGGVDRSQVTWTPWRRPRPNLGGVIRLVKWMRHHNRLGMAVGVRTKTLRYVPCCQDVETSKYACSLAFLTDRPPSPVSAHASILRRRGPDDGRPPRGALAAAARAGGSAQAVLHTWRRGQAARDGHSWPQQCNWARRGGAREPPQVGRRGRRCCVDLV